jgi:hypothetical protein
VGDNGDIAYFMTHNSALGSFVVAGLQAGSSPLETKIAAGTTSSLYKTPVNQCDPGSPGSGILRCGVATIVYQRIGVPATLLQSRSQPFRQFDQSDNTHAKLVAGNSPFVV